MLYVTFLLPKLKGIIKKTRGGHHEDRNDGAEKRGRKEWKSALDSS